MSFNNDVTMRNKTLEAAREIKSSAHYAYITGGITLDGSKFATNELVKEGQCLARRTATGKYEKYTETTQGTFEPGFDNPVILDESIQFKVNDAGVNPDVTAGQVLVHGGVYAGMCIGLTTAFKTKLAGAIRFD